MPLPRFAGLCQCSTAQCFAGATQNLAMPRRCGAGPCHAAASHRYASPMRHSAIQRHCRTQLGFATPRQSVTTRCRRLTGPCIAFAGLNAATPKRGETLPVLDSTELCLADAAPRATAPRRCQAEHSRCSTAPHCAVHCHAIAVRDLAPPLVYFAASHLNLPNPPPRHCPRPFIAP